MEKKISDNDNGNNNNNNFNDNSSYCSFFEEIQIISIEKNVTKGYQWWSKQCTYCELYNDTANIHCTACFNELYCYDPIYSDYRLNYNKILLFLFLTESFFGFRAIGFAQANILIVNFFGVLEISDEFTPDTIDAEISEDLKINFGLNEKNKLKQTTKR